MKGGVEDIYYFLVFIIREFILLENDVGFGGVEFRYGVDYF